MLITVMPYPSSQRTNGAKSSIRVSGLIGGQPSRIAEQPERVFFYSLAVGCLYGLALHGSSGLLLDEDFHILKKLGQRLGVGWVAPTQVEMAELIPKVCVPELSGNRLAVGPIAAVVRLGSAYVAGLELYSCLHNSLAMGYSKLRVLRRRV